MKRREAAIQREIEDPFNFSTELPHWKLADDALEKFGEVIILGGNRSGKDHRNCEKSCAVRGT